MGEWTGAFSSGTRKSTIPHSAHSEIIELFYQAMQYSLMYVWSKRTKETCKCLEIFSTFEMHAIITLKLICLKGLKENSGTS